MFRPLPLSRWRFPHIGTTTTTTTAAAATTKIGQCVQQHNKNIIAAVPAAAIHYSASSAASSQQGILTPQTRIIGKALQDRILSTTVTTTAKTASDEKVVTDDAFFVADLGEVYRQYEIWTSNLKRVKPYYAIKCNPDQGLIRFLAQLGTNFDCASKREIQQVLSANVSPSRILYANPCKSDSHLRYAAAAGVAQSTFDSVEELHKVKRLHPDSRLLLRIATDDASALCPLSMKYGAALEATPELLRCAKSLGLDVVGVSFHVGSGAVDPTAFYRAVRDARVVFDQAATLGFEFSTLDVGGGFSSGLFLEMARELNGALEEFFPEDGGEGGRLGIIAEPGRFFVETAFTLACQVIGCSAVRDRNTQQQMYKLFLNDGVYGNFSGIIFDHQKPVPKILKNGNRVLYGHGPIPPVANRSEDSGQQHALKYSIWGHSCDGMDMIAQNWQFPMALDAGDWLYFENMGAYTRCSATRFNGFKDDHDIVYVNSELGLSSHSIY